MKETYQDLKQRVESYFGYVIHIFLPAKHNKETCGLCFVKKDHPLHLKDEEKKV